MGTWDAVRTFSLPLSHTKMSRARFARADHLCVGKGPLRTSFARGPYPLLAGSAISTRVVAQEVVARMPISDTENAISTRVVAQEEVPKLHFLETNARVRWRFVGQKKPKLEPKVLTT